MSAALLGGGGVRTRGQARSMQRYSGVGPFEVGPPRNNPLLCYCELIFTSGLEQGSVTEDGGGKISASARREGDEPEDGGGKISASVRREDDEPPVLVCRRGPGTTLHPQSPIQGTVNPKSLKFPNMMMYGDRGNTTR